MKKMNQLIQSLLVIIVIVFFACNGETKKEDAAIETKWELSSPSKKIKVLIQLDTAQNNTLKYEVLYENGDKPIQIIEPSALGVIRQDQDFSNNLQTVSSSNITPIDINYTLVSGKQAQCSNQGNEITLSFLNNDSAKIDVIFRVFNDGVAFCYRFPEQSSEEYIIMKETTCFDLPDEGKAWMQPYDKVNQWAPAYETYYLNDINIGMPAPGKEGWAFPALFNTKDLWVLLTEANLDRTYFASHLEQNAENGKYKIKTPEEGEGEGTGKVTATTNIPWTSPWRLIVIGDNLGTIVETNLVTDLSSPSKIDDTSWIKPGKSSWSWWSDHDSPQNYNSLKKFIDFSAEWGWEYSLVDANWNIMKGGDIKQLVDYANSKGVGILMWYNSGGPHNVVTEQPRDIMNDPEKRKQEFAKLQEWGVKGIKVDFFQSDQQNIIKLYHDIMADAAEHQILVNFHGCTLPRGWRRTYPNLMTLESVKGAEVYSFGEDYPDHAPWHNTILPFTRNVVGPMDYTPVTFSDQKYAHITTYAHELSLAVVYESGIVHMADKVEAYRALPDFAQKYLQEVPVAWDETKFVSGTPGKLSVIARRKGDNWWIGGINGENKEKEISFSLPFLKENYSLELISDGENDESFNHEIRDWNAGEEMNLKMLPNGGFAAKLEKK